MRRRSRRSARSSARAARPRCVAGCLDAALIADELLGPRAPARDRRRHGPGRSRPECASGDLVPTDPRSGARRRPTSPASSGAPPRSTAPSVVEWRVGGDGHRHRPAARAPAAVGRRGDERGGQSELRPDHDLDVEVDVALEGFDDAAGSPKVSAARCRCADHRDEWHEVGQRDRARRCPEPGLEHHRVVDVRPRRAAGPRGRIDQKPPGSPRIRAKKAGESRPGRHAQSIDPARLTNALPWQLPRSA